MIHAAHFSNKKNSITLTHNNFEGKNLAIKISENDLKTYLYFKAFFCGSQIIPTLLRVNSATSSFAGLDAAKTVRKHY